MRLSRGQASVAAPVRQRSHRQTTHAQHGIGLIEVMLAVLIVSIGFLAGARMQVEGMRFSQSAYYRSQAYFMANDITDRMRANIEGVRNGDYDAGTTAQVGSRPECATTACSATEIALRDLAEWSDYLHPSTDRSPALPSSADVTAGGSIVPKGDGEFTIMLVWADKDGSDSLNVNFLTQF